MPGKTVHIKSIGTVNFLQNRRSKNIKISVKPDKSVLVSFPFFCTSAEVLAFIHKNETWIKDQQEKMEQKKVLIAPSSKFNSKLHTIVFLPGEKYDVETIGKDVTIRLMDFNSQRASEYTESIITQIYRYQAQKLLPERLEKLAREYGFSYNRVTIRNNKRNWGSCSARNNISLNLQMMKLPNELIDYILLHELVHTEIKNHSEQFWRRMNQITNNRARELSKKVRKYSTYTL